MQNSSFDTDASGWTLDNGLIYNNLNNFGWQNTEGNPSGSFLGLNNNITSSQDGLIQQVFTTPAAPVNARLSADHLDFWSGNYRNFIFYISLHIDGSAGYPNEVTEANLVSHDTTNGDPLHGSWQSNNLELPLTPSTSYIYRTKWYRLRCRNSTYIGAYVDNLVCNLSPSGLQAAPGSGNVGLSWNASVGAVALHATTPYRIYRSLTSGGPWTLIGNSNTNSFTDSSPPSASVVYYAVSDVDVNSVESPLSPEAMAINLSVRDGTGPDINYSFLEDRVEFNWDNMPASVLRYEVAVGTSAGGSDMVNWINVGTVDHATFSGLSLASGTRYYSSVRLVDLNGVVQSSGSSDGFVHRKDQVLTDTASQTFFHNARVLNMIDTTTDAGSIRPKIFSGTGGAGYWRYSCKVTVTEPGVTERINAPCRVQFAVPAGQMGNVQEIRVCDASGNEIPRYNLVTSTTNPDVVFLVNMAQGETRDYFIYWGNNGVSEPAYGWQVSSGLTSMEERTPYYTRKNFPHGMETVPLAYNFGYNGGVDFERGGNYSYWRDDARSDAFNLPWPFWFYGVNRQNNWRANTNGLLYINSSNYGDYSNTWWEFSGTRWQPGIAPFWVDLKYDNTSYPQNPGVFMDTMSNPDRVVFTWRTNRYTTPDDIYIFQTVLYRSGDIAHRYGYLSPLGVLGPGGTDRPVNTENTVGITNGDNTRYMFNTPLNVGIAKSPTAFYQCMDAFRGNYVVGPITGGAVGAWVDVAHMESMVFDSRTTTPDWQTIESDCVGGASGRLVIDVRSGPTPLPELGGWNAWQNVATTQINGSAAIPSPDERYLQYRVTFQRNGTASNPVLNEVRLIYGGISIDEVIANTPGGVSQGQDNIPVEVKVRNFYSAAVDLDSIELTFSLGTYTQTLSSPALSAPVPAGGVVSFFFDVDVAVDSLVGTATIHAVATATSGALTFSDNDTQLPHQWLVKRRAELVITQVETEPTHVNKGQNGVPVRIYMQNIGEVPYDFAGATLTFSLGDYTQALLLPPVGTSIAANSSFIATMSVNILLSSPSGVSVIDATASGTNSFTGKVTDNYFSAITDSWTIQNSAQLVLKEVTASSTVYRGQTNTPVLLRVSNQGEALANWEVSDILSHFTLGTYDAVYAVTGFPLQIPGGLETTGRYGVDISPVSATGTSDVDADISGTDDNTLFPLTWSGALLPTSWTILAEKVNTFSDPSFNYPSSSFNRPFAGTLTVYAKSENLVPYGEYVFRWFDSTDSLMKVSAPVTADASGTLTNQYELDNTSGYGNWKVQVTNPVASIVACENFFEVVSPADLSLLFTMPAFVSEGQPFVASLTLVNSGGAAIDSAFASALDYFGPGVANLVSGPNPAVINVPGNGQATITYDFSAVSAGNFSASGTAYGFDANSGDFLTSPAATGNICVIQEPPLLVTQSITAVPTIVYLNQKNLSISVVVRNDGQATAILDAASLTFDVGGFEQTIVSPTLPYSLAGGNQVTFTYDIGVASDSATGLSTFNSNVYWYDNNYPASSSWLTGAPTDSWTISDVGLLLSADGDFVNSLQDDFNQLQTVYVRAYGLTPGSQWYRIRFYNSEIPQAAQGPLSWQNVSPQLSADVDGYVDYLYSLPAAATIGTWSVIIEDDADTNAGTRGNLLGLQYFRVQNPGTLLAEIYLTPATVFVGEEFSVTMIATNTVAQSSSIVNASPAALIPTAASAGSATLISGPAPASATIDSQKSEVFTWTYRADSDTGLVGSFSLTPDNTFNIAGFDKNTSNLVISNKSFSDSIVFYDRNVNLSSDTLDFSSLECGHSLMIGDTVAVNVGNYPLDDIQWISTDLNGPAGNKISKANLNLMPSPVGAIAPGSSVPARAELFVPYNQYAGDYIATMSIFNDRNANNAFDIDEVYDLFNVKVTVPSSKNVFMVEPYVDLKGWEVNKTTTELQIHGFSGGNLPLDDLKFKQIVGTNTFSISVLPNPGAVPMTGSFVASVSAVIPPAAILGEYIATWTVYNDANGDNIVNAGEASDTFQVWIQVGTRNFSVAPDPIDAGSTEPSTVVSGFGGNLSNSGTLKLSALKPNFVALTDGLGNSIASDGISIDPALPQPINGGDIVPITFSLFVPAGTPAGVYSAGQQLYHDDNNNNLFDAGESQSTFTLQVTVLPAPKVQVLVSTVDVGGMSPGTTKVVSFACRNVGNVDLNNLRWEKKNLLSGANSINAANVTFPPSEPFSVPAGQFFWHDIQVTVPALQPYGTYWSVAPDFWLYNDSSPVNLARDPGEAESNFRVTCQVGLQDLDIIEASLNSAGDPNANSATIVFNVKNIGSLDLSSLRATGSVLLAGLPGAADIAATNNIFSPANIGALLIGQTKQSSWRVSIPANASATTYTGQLTVWEDANKDGIIDAAEARDTSSLSLVVNAKRVIDVVQTQLDLGWAAPNTSAQGQILIRNSGNIIMNDLDSFPANIVSGFSNIPAASISFIPDPLGALAVGAEMVATVSVIVGNNQPDGTYKGNQRVYDDYNPTNSTYDAAEESDTFELLLRVGKKSFYEQAVNNPPVDFGLRSPSGVYNQSFSVFNATAIPLTKMKWKIINQLDNGGDVFPAGRLALLPSGVTNVGGGGNRTYTASVTIDPYQPPGNYIATASIYEDDNNDNLIQAAEASATFNILLQVDSVASLDIIPVAVDFGQIAQGDTGSKEIMFRNTGNVTLTNFSWIFSSLDKAPDQISDSDLKYLLSFIPDPVLPGQYASSTVEISVPAGQALGLYGPSGPQTMGAAVAGAHDDWSNFKCEVIAGGAPTFQLGAGSVAQEVATTSFAAAAPNNQYFLSVWVSPGSGSANLSFVAYDVGGVAVATVTAGIDSAGTFSAAGTGINLTNSGILASYDFEHPSYLSENLQYYRLFIAFEYTHDELIASHTRIVLSNSSPDDGNKYRVWFDGVQLEKGVEPDQTRPTSYHKRRTLFSPSKKSTISGEDLYYEW
jgi:hypothetical protein